MNDPAVQSSPLLAYGAHDLLTFGRKQRVLLAITWVYPLLPLVSLYLTWFVAWMVLGHQPRSSLDDPKSINAAVDIPYLVTALLLLSMPIGALIGVMSGMILTAWWVHLRGGGVTRSVILAAALLGLYVGVIALLRWDPAQVLNWYMD